MGQIYCKEKIRSCFSLARVCQTDICVSILLSIRDIVLGAIEQPTAAGSLLSDREKQHLSTVFPWHATVVYKKMTFAKSFDDATGALGIIA
jgi:hypothetical protein